MSTVAVVSKMYCSSSQAVLVVRRRPHVVNGGGFVVTDCTQKVVFRVDGCATLGTSGELVLRDGQGNPLLLIRRQGGGVLQALSIHKKWKGYTCNYEDSQKLAFSLKEPVSHQNSICFGKKNNNQIRISLEPRKSSRDWNFQVDGYFPDRDCSIVDSNGHTIAKVGVKTEVDELMESKDIYHVTIRAGVDQAFVFGMIAILDHIYGESTTC
ncbi:protein LURP-one-related 6-like [Punica granatum]|uniref:Uncharacterized protein n=2 Tax=Punica granatum TaxID=22663 RepID=A0A218WX85_PUNGR|nr:protein LURP-one-related 6-like [Punica granatum]OWM77324.1 hypothetical protein CDL15_Pgr028961 [Punica granatum]PKI43496.1 hypothetical protein CRG98_036098 [Punica granatum]